ncbi:hypothetical protein [Pelagerythrobacter aerophilus]|uniref:Uncharacterized protein n=1 Tax=Pelagerythrobacter aerophilus TaxID=2306995 RepID=A0A418NM05_9SPHN|nr:hypothetical protein [Pelagerythrobacter aerophilus]RIV81267.1 hypothetical protein D2V04_01285 [Pelagerythrobacter aerophilus]
MTISTTIRRTAIAGFACAAALLLTGCLLSPGRFTSQLELRKSGTFVYSYDGEIYLLALSKLADLGNAAEDAADEFVEQSCYDDETFEDRECTEEELAKQKSDWEQRAEERQREREREAEMTRAMLGGIDPADPEAAQEFAERLQRQAGWESVEYKGDGLFQVSFRVAGRLDHDFVFPTIERLPTFNFFVLVARRDNGTVRIDAPGFAPQSSGSPFREMMAGMAGSVASDGSVEQDTFPVPELNGTFRVVTDGEILANNTDEGPAETEAGQVLEWKITKRTQVPPTALIKLTD